VRNRIYPHIEKPEAFSPREAAPHLIFFMRVLLPEGRGERGRRPDEGRAKREGKSDIGLGETL
jgi:hypothetical protein